MGRKESNQTNISCVKTDMQSKKDSNDQESIQSSNTPYPGYQMGK